MDFDALIHSLKPILNGSHLTSSDEESVPASVWQDRASSYISFVNKLKTESEKHSVLFCPPPVQLLILLGGIIGNFSSSKKLHQNVQLYEATNSILDAVCASCQVSGTRDMLLLSPRPGSQPRSSNLSIQCLRLCVAHLARSNNKDETDAFSTCPLFRDCLIWLSAELEYPEICDREFVAALQPLGLRLTADYRLSLQLVGFRVLRDLTLKVSKAIWRECNRAEAVISQIFDHRVASNPGSSEVLLHEAYAALLSLIQLLEPTKIETWHNALADRLLFDISMECRKIRQTVLLRHLSTLIDSMGTAFAAHTCRFARSITVILLGPHSPDQLQKSLPVDALDSTVHLIALQCVHKFVRLCWPLVSPTLLPKLLPPLIAFVDLEDHFPKCQTEEVRKEMTNLLLTIVSLDNRILADILKPACSTVPALTVYLRNM